MKIETVLCPIDFSTLSDFELTLAVEVCEAFDANLVLHHNLAAAAPGLHKAWEWEKDHHGRPEEVTEPEARRRMEDVMRRLPPTVRAQARISRGPVGLVLLYLIKEVSADLVILGSHGWSSDEHTSLSERVIDCAPCPVLSVQEGRGDRHPLRLRVGDGGAVTKVLVPTDFSDSAATAVAYALELARRSPLEVHLLHVRSPGEIPIMAVDHAEAVAAARDASDATRRRLGELVPTDLAERVKCHAEVGSAAAGIMVEAKKLGADLIVMGEHARGFFRRYFTHDTAREMLHRARCPVWFVPAGYAV